MSFVPIFGINASITIGTMLKCDANADANVGFDVNCERTFTDCYLFSTTDFLKVLAAMLK